MEKIRFLEAATTAPQPPLIIASGTQSEKEWQTILEKTVSEKASSWKDILHFLDEGILHFFELPDDYSAELDELLTQLGNGFRHIMVTDRTTLERWQITRTKNNAQCILLTTKEHWLTCKDQYQLVNRVGAIYREEEQR